MLVYISTMFVFVNSPIQHLLHTHSLTHTRAHTLTHTHTHTHTHTLTHSHTHTRTHTRTDTGRMVNYKLVVLGEGGVGKSGEYIDLFSCYAVVDF